MIPHSRKDASGRSQLSKAEGELAFKFWQKGDKGGRGGRGQKEEGGRIEAKKRTWEAFKKCYSYKLTAITIHQPFPLIISLLFKRFIYLIRYLIFINHIKSGGVPDYLRAVHTHTHTHTHIAQNTVPILLRWVLDHEKQTHLATFTGMHYPRFKNEKFQDEIFWSLRSSLYGLYILIPNAKSFLNKQEF